MQDNTGRFLVTLRAFAAGAVLSFFFVSGAMADSLNLGTAGQFGIVSDNGVTFQQNNGNITGNIAIGAGGTFQASGPSTITGQIDFADCIGTGSGCNGTVSNGYAVNQGSAINNTTVTGGTASNPSLVKAAVSSWDTLSSQYSGQSGTSLTLPSSGTLAVTGGTTHIYDLTNVNLNGGTLTIQGGANDVVIFNISGSVKLTGETIVLSGGITSDNVLWNILSTGNNFSSSGGCPGGPCQVSGDFDDVSGNPNLNEIDINGRIFGGGSSMQLVSNFYLNSPPPSTVPEPSSLVLLGTGLSGMAYLRRRRS